MCNGIEPKRTALLLAFGVAAAPVAWAGSPTIESTFDASDEGWTAVGFDIGITPVIGIPPISVTSVAMTDNTGDLVFDPGGGAFDGNPGGFARLTDMIPEPASFARAPGAFLGDLSGYVGGTFSFDHRLFSEGSNASTPFAPYASTPFAPYALFFFSGDPDNLDPANLNAYGAVFDAPVSADTGWVNLSVDITDGGPNGLTAIDEIDLGVFDPLGAGFTAGDAGVVTTASFNDVMSNVSMVLVAFELVDNNNTQNSESGGIDNVRLEAVPEPGSIVLLGLAGLALVRRRRA